MNRELELITPGDILLEEFLNPLEISQNKLARDIDVSPSNVSAVIKGTRSISPDLALRLAEYFGTSPELWLNMQNHYDLEKLKREKGDIIRQSIRKLSPQHHHATRV